MSPMTPHGKYSVNVLFKMARVHFIQTTTCRISKLIGKSKILVVDRWIGKGICCAHCRQNGDWLKVPADFVSDLASIPVLLWWMLPPWDEYARAAVVHDYLFQTGKYGWRFSNKAMLHLMKEDGVDWWKQRFVYRGLQIGSWPTWSGCRLLERWKRHG